MKQQEHGRDAFIALLMAATGESRPMGRLAAFSKPDNLAAKITNCLAAVAPPNRSNLPDNPHSGATAPPQYG